MRQVIVLALLCTFFLFETVRAQAPVNDSPCGALEVVPGTPLGFDLTYTTADSGEVSPGRGSDPGTCNRQDGWCFFEPDVQNSAWYKLVVPPSGCVSVLAQGFDLQLAMYTVSNCADYTSFVEIAGNDDSGNLLDNTLPISGPAGLVEVSCLPVGETVYIQVDGFNGAAGQGVLTVFDCGNAPLTLDAGACQTLYSGGNGAIGDTAFLNYTVSGGFLPYNSITWAADPSILYTNADFNGAAAQPTTTTSYTVTVVDNRGCVLADEVTVNVENVNDCQYAPAAGNFRTQTQGGWGSRARGGNAGEYRDQNFAGAFPNGITVGACNKTITLTSSAAVQNFLPSGSQPRALDQSYVDPAPNGPGGYKNVLAGQVVALGLSLGFDAYDENYSASDVALGDLKVAEGPMAGLSVSEVYALANEALGGCPGAVNASAINNVVTRINENFVDGTSAGTYLSGEGVAMCNGSTDICASPDEVSIFQTLGYTLGSCGNTCTATNPSFPAPPPCETLRVTATGDVFANIDNSWQLLDLTSGEFVQPLTPMVGLVTETAEFCVDPTHCYEFTIFDLSGNGFDLIGDYTIEYMGNTIYSDFFSNGTYGQLFQETWLLGACGNKTARTHERPQEAQSIMNMGMESRVYPNPFSQVANIEFTLPENDFASVEVLSITGEVVARPFSGEVYAGKAETVTFDGTELPAGMYFFRIASEKGYNQEGKMMLQH